MKKILITISLIFIAGCSSINKPENTNYSEVFMEENSKTALDVINQAIADLNHLDTNELKDTLYQRRISVPVDIGIINPLETIEICEPIINEHSNAEFIGICPISDNYNIEVKIFDLNANFWDSGEISFLYKEIPSTSLENKEIENTLSTLLKDKDKVLNDLFGFSTACLEETEELSCLVISGQQDGQAYLDNLKEQASTKFSQEYLHDYDTILYNSNTPVWKVDESGLHLTMMDTLTNPSFNYEPTTIGAISYQDNKVIINCCVSYMEETVNEVHQIILVDEGEGYRILSMQ